jgi:glucuronide carrier protein
LAWGGYTATSAQQSTSAEWGIRAGVGLLPAVFGLLAVLVMAAYPLTDRRHASIVAEIADRRAAMNEPPAGDPSLSTAALRVDDGAPITRLP